MNTDKSFFERSNQQVREAYSCDRCGNTEGVQEFYNVSGGEARLVWINCPEAGCGGRAPREDVIRDPASGKVIRVPEEEQTVNQQVRDCLREDTQRGEKGGGSSGSKGRKKPVKRDKARVEQEPVMFNGGSGGSIVIKRKVERYTEPERVVLYVPEKVKKKISKEAKQRSRIDHTEWSMSKVVRYAMWDHLKRIEVVKNFSHGKDEKVYLEVQMYPDEKALLDEYRKEHGNCSRGEMVAACVKEFAKEAF